MTFIRDELRIILRRKMKMRNKWVGRLSFIMAIALVISLFNVGEVTAKPKYDKIYSFSNGMAQVRVGDEETGKYGYINDKGKTVVQPIYDTALDFHNGRAIVSKNKKFFVVDKNGKVVNEIKLEKGAYVYHVAKDIYTFLGNAGQGLFNVKGKINKKLIYNTVDDEHEGLVVVRKKDKFGVVDLKGKEIVRPKYDYIDFFEGGVCRVRLGNDAKWKYGFVDKKGREIIKPQYDNLNYFSEGLAAFGIGKYDDEGQFKGKWGFIDKKGKVVIKPVYDRASRFSEGLARVWKGNELVYINKRGEEVLTAKYHGYTEFVNGGYSGFRAYMFEEITEEQVNNESVSYTGDFHEGLAVIIKGNLCGLMDKKGNIILGPKYNYISNFSDGRAVVRKRVKGNEKYGMIDKKGKEIIEPIYDESYMFDNKFTRFGTGFDEGRLVGYADNKGEFIIKPIYQNFNFFITKTGYPAYVKKDGKWGKFNEKDESRTEFIYDDFSYFESSKIAPVRKGDDWYIINQNGKELYKVE